MASCRSRIPESNGRARSPWGGADPQWWGAAVGLACDINEKLTLAGRAEYFYDDNGARLPLLDPNLLGPSDEVDYYSATGTLSYHLTERLMARAEYRYDTYDADPQALKSFPTDRGTSFEDDNHVGMVEVSYSFD